MNMKTLNPAVGPVAWRDGVLNRFRFNAARCRKEALTISDPEERVYIENLAVLWEQLADAAAFRQEFSQ